MNDKAKLGFVLGKFMPPHNGHVFLCEFARQYCEHLIILVCSLPDDPIPGELRFQWMKRMFPDCSVIHEERVLPQEPQGENDEAFWTVWREVVHLANTRTHGGERRPIDVVFASEPYGARLAKEVGARFVPVDITRSTHAISGTMVRDNPFRHWHHIPPIVRAHFVKRVVLFGPESTGKTTLARQLADHFDTTWVPEYGRTYTEFFGHENLGPEDFHKIVSGHLASVAAAKLTANRILIEDTDPVLSAVWSDMLLGERDPWFNQYCDYGDLYVLTNIDTPWVDDGTRYFEDRTARQHFFNLCETELIRRKIPHVIVSGSPEKRLNDAVEAINLILGDKT